MKYATLISLFFVSTLSYSQVLGGHQIKDYWVTAVHNNNCDPSYVIGPPDDSTWVNFAEFDVVQGNFAFTWVDKAGDDLLLETSFHADNMDIRLLLKGGGFSAVHRVSEADWQQISSVNWKWVESSVCVRHFSIAEERFVLPLDFNQDFGLASSDQVEGVEITFLATQGAPDLAGVYIISACDSVNLGKDTILCEGDSLVLDATEHNASYQWQDNSTNPTFVVRSPGKYWVDVVTNNCRSTDTILVKMEPSIHLDLGDDTTLCINDTLALTVAAAHEGVLWQDSSAGPEYVVKESGTYWVQVASNNCTFTDSIHIKFKDCAIVLDLPNVFTPNNDGINDVYLPLNAKGIASMRSTFFSRWGEKVYQTTDPMIRWDGGEVADGTYFWVIQYVDRHGRPNEITGHVTLIR